MTAFSLFKHNAKPTAMKKTLMLSGMLFCLWMLQARPAAAQVDYTVLETTDHVQIEYRWQRDSYFGRDPQAVLNLKLTNMSDAPLEVRFTAGFYRDGQLFLESSEQMHCLRPWESKRGARGDLRFTAENIRMSTLEEEWFSWDVPLFEVTRVEKCED